MAEFSNYTPSLKDRMVAALAGAFGGDRAAYDRANKLVGNNDPDKQVALEAAHAGAYFTPAAPVVGAYDLGSAIAEPVKRIAGALMGGDENPISNAPEMTRDQFFAAHRRATKSKEDILSDELNSLKSSGNYQESGPKNRAKLETEASKRADARYSAQAASSADQEAQINQDWQAELADRKARVDAVNRQPWYQRHPLAADAAYAGGSVAAGLLARRGFNKIADEGKGLLDAVNTAKAAGNIGDEVAARQALADYQGNLTKNYIKTGIKTAAIPAELRSAGTGYDALLMPEIRDKQGNIDPTSARQQAQAEIGKSFTTAEGAARDWGLPAASGATASMVGALMSRRPPVAGMSANANYLAGLTKDATLGASPDALAIPLGDARMAMLRKQQEVQDAMRGKFPTQSPPQALEAEPAASASPAPALSPPTATPSPEVPALPPPVDPNASAPTNDAITRALMAPTRGSSPEAPRRVIGGSHPDHNWNEKAQRWQDPNNNNEFLSGGPPKK